MFAKDAVQAEAAAPEGPDGQRTSGPALLALARLLGRLAALETGSSDDYQGPGHD